MSSLRKSLSGGGRVAELQAAFASFDEDGNGRIAPNELSKMISKITGEDASDAELKAILKSADADGDGTIDFDEFMELMKQPPAHADGELMGAFKAFDLNGDGFISADELLKAFNTAGDGLSMDDVKQMIKDFDADGDGRIDYGEFVSMMGDRS